MTNIKKRSIYRMPVGTDSLIHTSVMILAVFGLVMVTSATMGKDAANYMNLIITVAKQLAFTVAGYVAMVVLSRLFTFELCRKWFGWIMGATFFFLLFTLCFEATGGAHAWIKIPLGFTEVSIQPSEFAKISIMLVMATYLGDVRITRISDKELIKAPTILVLAMVGIVAIVQSDFGSSVVMLGIATVLFLIPRNAVLRKMQTKLLLLLGFGFAAVVVLMSPVGEFFLRLLPFAQYQVNRFLTAMNPFADRYGSGFQLIKGLISFASGGLTGVGFGASIQKYMNFPAASTDYILAIVVEELGIGGFFLIFILYMIIVCRLFSYAMKIESEKGRMILIGTAMYLFIHYLFNVGGVTGLIPLTGVPLLLISAGGSSSLSFMMSIGVAQAVISRYRQGKLK